VANSIEKVLREFTDVLLGIPGIVGTAQGECGGRPCIKVYILQNAPHLRGQIPSSIEGYSVEVEITGPIEAFYSS